MSKTLTSKFLKVPMSFTINYLKVLQKFISHNNKINNVKKYFLKSTSF